MIKFNVNNYVRVKLNDTGMDILKRNHEEFQKAFPSAGEFKDHRDEDGYMKFQLWSLMEIFGPHISLGTIPPFDTDIELETYNDQ